MKRIRWIRYAILASYAGVFAALTIALSVFVIPVAILLVPRYRFWLYRLFLHSAACPTCGASIPLEGSWQCGGCGFVQFRHAYRRCVKCKAFTVETACPACQHGMFL